LLIFKSTNLNIIFSKAFIFFNELQVKESMDLFKFIYIKDVRRLHKKNKNY